MATLARRASISDLAALRTRTGISAIVPGPCFAGSADVGGADADLIVGDFLLEIKTNGRPANTATQSLRQLLGYLLLAYGIRSVGIYYTRHGQLIQWASKSCSPALRPQRDSRNSVMTVRQRFARPACI
jgi:hypothetical protein